MRTVCLTAHLEYGGAVADGVDSAVGPQHPQVIVCQDAAEVALAALRKDPRKLQPAECVQRCRDNK